MMYWPGIFVIAVAIFIGGWLSHLWYCKRRNSCPLWQRDSEEAWLRELAKKYPAGRVASIPPEVWSMWRPAPALDETERAGVPSQIEPTPTTGIANDKRRT